MSQVIEALCAHARVHPDRIALRDSEQSLSYAELWRRIEAFAEVLRHCDSRVVGLMSDNCIDWVVADLAALLGHVAIVPLPPYFTASQLQYVIDTSGIDMLALDDVSTAARTLEMPFEPVDGRFGRLSLLLRTESQEDDRADASLVAKITFTSGSTGQPKGVCLTFETINQVATRLCELFSEIGIQQHLCVMPLATLLENVAGVYVPLMLGATVHVPSLTTLGLYGSSQLDTRRFTDAIESASAESLILQPQLLRALTTAYRATGRQGGSLKFVAVGGAKVSQSDLDDAHAVGIPAYQGYGLSECCSVVALNRPGNSRPGSVGRPLPGVSVDIDSHGEILVSRQCMLGYLGEQPTESGRIRTGDIGYLDDGFLYVTGRKKNVFITSFGRNVSPEWPEAELLHQTEIVQACVFGEARPVNTAVVVPSDSSVADGEIANAIANANNNLPDYARISDWVVADEPFTVANGLLTPTGKARRNAVELRYIIDSERRYPRSTNFTQSDSESIKISRNPHEAV